MNAKNRYLPTYLPTYPPADLTIVHRSEPALARISHNSSRGLFPPLLLRVFCDTHQTFRNLTTSQHSIWMQQRNLLLALPELPAHWILQTSRSRTSKSTSYHMYVLCAQVQSSLTDVNTRNPTCSLFLPSTPSERSPSMNTVARHSRIMKFGNCSI